MHMDPKVEVLLAVYNGERFIGEQIDSILNQSHKNFHILIRDNCSTDNTREIIGAYYAKHPGLFTILPSEKNIGIIGNFSTLLDHSTAHYVMFSDHDDVWLPNKISKTLEKMKEVETQAGAETPILVHTDLKVVNSTLDLIDSSFWNYSKLNPKMTSLPRQLIQNQVTGCTTMINRPLIDIASPIPQNIVMHDWWLAICASAFGKIGVVYEPTMLYRQHGSNDTGAKKYSFFTHLKRLYKKSNREKLINHKRMVFEQAKEFLHLKQHLLDEKSIELVEAFIRLEGAFFWSKAFSMIKNGFLPVGTMRNLAAIFRFRRS